MTSTVKRPPATRRPTPHRQPEASPLGARKTSRTRLLPTLLLTLTLLVTLLALPASASAEGNGWQVRINGLWVDPDVSFTDLDSNGDRVQAGADGGSGASLTFERRFSSRLGLEFGALYAEPDLSLDASLGGTQFTASSSVTFTAVTAGLNIHLTPDKAVDLYLGPLVAQVLFGDVGLRARVAGAALGQDFSANDDFAFGAQVGADVAFGDSPWSLNLAAKYLDTSLEITDEDGEKTDLGFEPLILGVGFGYRF